MGHQGLRRQRNWEAFCENSDSLGGDSDVRINRDIATSATPPIAAKGEELRNAHTILCFHPTFIRT